MDESHAHEQLLASWQDSTDSWAALYTSSKDEAQTLYLYKVFRFVDDDVTVTSDSIPHAGVYSETRGDRFDDPRKLWIGVKCKKHGLWVFKVAVPWSLYNREWRAGLIRRILLNSIDHERELNTRMYLKCPGGGHIWPVQYGP